MTCQNCNYGDDGVMTKDIPKNAVAAGNSTRECFIDKEYHTNCLHNTVLFLDQLQPVRLKIYCKVGIRT